MYTFFIVAGLIIVIASLVYWFCMSSFSQFFGRFPFQASTKEKLIALTFDDGPNEPYTSQIVDFLDNKKIKATFFMVGKCIQKYPDIVKKIDKSGHIIGNHSLSHSFRNYIFHPYFYNEVITGQEIIHKIIGKYPKLFRPPWLWRQPMLLKTVRKLGMTPVSGEFCNVFEVFQPNSSKIITSTLKKIKPGAIIIFHDGFDAKGGNRSQTVNAVKQIVAQLDEQGYKFVTVDKLLKIKPYK